MLKRLRIFLSPRNFRLLLGLLAATGLASLALTVIGGDQGWAVALQSLLLLVFLVGAAGLFLSRLPSEERKRWLGLALPALLAMLIGSLVAPQLGGLFLGAGLGWIVAGMFIFRRAGSVHVKTAVKAMRKQDYKAAIAAMDAQIREEPRKAEHYRFRAELHRLAGRLSPARKNYQRMIELEPGSAVAHNGLAEVELQAGRYPQAAKAARQAQELAPDEWVAAYNLGMIEDRLQDSRAVIRHLEAALAAKIPDSRHRLLAHLYLWRAHTRLDDAAAAEAALASLRRERAGQEEWQVIMSADEAQALRAVLADDIKQARQLIAGEPVSIPR
ncbi:MAG: tetratricopeptide repeat protein [Chloroflexi bacterium]|nr:tetratricopeptide repeat protein [Chloroflexota bacterium]MYA92137.1 tetratricopeptide repeat protein [Chloroflexota bacterium]MYE77836.1 tetratricopeptide repeat protein [Chloroflexota bacterium]